MRHKDRSYKIQLVNASVLLLANAEVNTRPMYRPSECMRAGYSKYMSLLRLVACIPRFDRFVRYVAKGRSSFRVDFAIGLSALAANSGLHLPTYLLST